MKNKHSNLNTYYEFKLKTGKNLNQTQNIISYKGLVNYYQPVKSNSPYHSIQPRTDGIWYFEII